MFKLLFALLFSIRAKKTTFIIHDIVPVVNVIFGFYGPSQSEIFVRKPSFFAF